MARALFLSVAADEDAVTAPEEMVNLTFLSRLLNAAHITQALLVSLLQSSYIDDPELESTVQRLTSTLRWEWEDEVRSSHSRIWAVPSFTGTPRFAA